MKKQIIITAAMLILGIAQAAAQQSYSYYVERRIPINWRPETKDVQRYTVAVHPFHLVNNGLKFDFEYELRVPGEWLQVSLIGYAAPTRTNYYNYRYGDNARYTPNSGYDDYRHMWGVGTSALYKKMWHQRGWYFSTGLVLEFYRVGRSEYGYVPYKEDGLTFYDRDRYTDIRSFFKTTAQFNLGKHFSLSRRCFLDAFIGVSYSYSFYDNRPHPYNESHKVDYYYDYYYNYNGMNGFARRGFNVNCGLRFGVLLWDKQQ